jgi:TrmH family RNA methyltransferase
MVEITSLRNPLIKRIRSLGHKKYRQKEQCFWAEGIRIVWEALELGWDIETLVWAPELLRSDPTRQMVADARVRKVTVSERVFQRLSERENPQGLGALIHIPERSLADLAVGSEAFLVILEEPQDPGNVGTIVRTVDGAGGTGVILLGNSADPYDPQSVRASMGSLFAVPVVADVGISDFVAWAKERGLWLVGTSARAERCYWEAGYRRPLALLFGSEQKGLSKALWDAADEVVLIPMRGRATSLNLASAVAVMAFQAQSGLEH